MENRLSGAQRAIVCVGAAILFSGALLPVGFMQKAIIQESPQMGALLLLAAVMVAYFSALGSSYVALAFSIAALTLTLGVAIAVTATGVAVNPLWAVPVAGAALCVFGSI